MPELDLSKIDLGGFGINEDEKQTQLNANVSEAVKVNPDEHVQIKKLSEESGVPEFAVKSDIAQVEHKLKLDKINLDGMVERAPATSNFLTADLNNPIIAQEDVVSGLLEGIEKTFSNIGKTIGIGFKMQGKGLQLAGTDATPDRVEDLIPMSAFPIGMEFEAPELSRQLASNLGIESDEDLALAKQEATDKLLGDIQKLQAERQALTPEDMNIVQEGVRAGVESIAQMLPGIGLTVLSGGRTAPMLFTMGAQTFAGSYGEGRADGLTPEEARWYASIDAAIEVGTEILPTGTIERILTGESKGLKKDALKFIVQEMGTEQLATLGQTFNAYMFGLDEELENATTAEEVINIQLRRQAVTAIATIVAGGSQVAAASAVNKTVEKLTQTEQQKETQAQVEQRTIDQLNADAQKSKLKERDTESFKQFIREADGENNTTVFIDGVQTALYLQSKTREEVETDPALKTLSNALAESRSTGADVAIPVDEFMGDVTGTAHFEQLREHMTMSDESISPFRQEQHREETQNYIQTLMNEAQENASEYVEAQEIYTQVRDQLVDSGTVNPQNASIMAQIVPAWATAQARREGKTVQQVYQDSGLTIEGPQTGEKARLEGETVLEQSVIDQLPEDMWEINRIMSPFESDMNVEELMTLTKGLTEQHKSLHSIENKPKYVSDESLSQIPNPAFIQSNSKLLSHVFTDTGEVYRIIGKTGGVTQLTEEESSNFGARMLSGVFNGIRESSPEVQAKREVQRKQQEEQRRRDKRINEAPKATGDFDADVKTLVEYADNFEEFKQLLSADMLDVSDRNRTRLARAVIALDPEVETAANVVELQPDMIEDSKKYGTPAERAAANAIDSKSKSITIYRAMPATGKIEAGDWVGLVKSYAKGHESNTTGEKAVTRQKTVPKEDLYWYGADFNEWVYIPKGTWGDYKSLQDVWSDLAPGKPMNYESEKFMQFAGPKAVNAQLQSLERAKEMKEAGNVSNESIRRQTGWFKGVDNRWRYEISDDKASFDIQIDTIQEGMTLSLYELLDHPELYSAYPDLQTMKITFSPDLDARGTYYPRSDRIALKHGRTEQETLSTLLHEIQHAIQEREDFARGGSNEAEFTDSIKKALNQLKARKVESVLEWEWLNSWKINEANYAAEVAKEGLMYKSMTKLMEYANHPTPSSVFRHVRNETQWIYDSRFRTESGSAINDDIREIEYMFYDIPRRGPKRNQKISEIAFKTAQQLRDQISPENLRRFKEDERTLDGMIKSLQREASKKAAELEPQRELQREAKAAETVAEKAKWKSPHDVYLSLAGEIEARTTQARQHLTEEERQARSVLLDMDVQPDEAVVIIGGMEIMAPTSMMSAQQPQQDTGAARGYFDPENVIIRLTESADLSTFLHEFAHFMYEMEAKGQTEMNQSINNWYKRNSADVAAEATKYLNGQHSVLKQGEQVTEGRQVLESDVVNYLDSGSTGNSDVDAAVRRAVHEQFARGFETYLMEGKAPSIELRNAFRTFARWLAQIYQSLRGQLNVKLDDEMRQVFDRLLATEEQIVAAESRARVEPLFTDAAMAGMTEEEFADYQKRQEKVKDVQSETLRDKLIKELTRKNLAWWKEEVNDLIDEEMDTLSKERVYATANRLKHTASTADVDKKVQETKDEIKSIEKQIDKLTKESDTIGKFIAKRGGLNREDMEAEGIDPANFKERGKVFGKPLFPKNGGMTADDVAELLNENGYDIDANEALDIINDMLMDDSTFLDSEVEGEIDYLGNQLSQLEMDLQNLEQEARTVNIKLDHATVKEMIGEERTDKLGRTSTRIPDELRGMTAKGQAGVHPDEAAAFFGYNSGSEMLEDLVTAPPMKEVAEERAQSIMFSRHGDIFTDGTIEQQADEAVQNEERGKLILHELKMLSRGTNQRVIDRKTMKSVAEERIGNLSFREIHPGKYRKAEIRAAQESARMLAEGNKEGAAHAKARQALNYYLGMAATEAKNETTNIVDRMARYNKKKVREEIMKAEGGYWEQIVKILERFEFRKTATLKQVDQINQDINTWAKERMEIDGDGLVLHNAVLNESYVTHWKNVAYSDLKGINDSVKNIEHVARYANKLTRMGEEIEFNKLVDRWVTSMDENVETRFKSKRTDVVEGKKWGRWLMAQMTKIPFMASWLDGGERAGISHQVLVQPFTEAYNDEIKLWESTGKPVMEAIENRSKEDIKRHNRKIYIREIDDTLYGHQILAVALNTGNEGNLKKLLLGEQWANPDNDAEINLQNPKLQAVLSHMTESDWNMVQMIWDQMDTLYPQLAEVHRRTTGLTPPKVEATPVQTPFGEFRGGYYPVKYDPNRSHKAAQNEDKLNAETESMFSNGASIQASVNAGATNERTGFYDAIRLSLDVVPAHFQETIHYITHHDPVREINRLTRDARVAKTIKEKLGPEEYAQLKPWLNDIAKDGREAPTKMFWDDILQRLRFGVTLGAMGFKASTGIIQISGLSNTISEVGMANTMQAMRSILGSRTTMKTAWEFAVENSKVLEHRAQTMDREIKNAMKRIEGKRGVLAAVQEASMKHIALIQTYMVDTPSWHAAYIKGMKEWGDETRAFQYADWVIENVQGSGATKDLARIMRGQSETGRMFTMFMTFFSSLWNMERDLVKGAKAGTYSTTDLAAKAMFLFTVPVLFEMLMRGEFSQDDDDEESLTQTMLTKTALYPIQSVPFVRDIANAVTGDFGYNISPMQAIIEQGTQTIPQVVTRGFTDEEITKGQAKGATKFIGAATGIPGTAQAWASGEHLYDVVVEGEEFTMHQFLFGPERK